ncbi:MAG: thiamine phosphate synthase [Deltaproteobacteria bacterium]
MRKLPRLHVITDEVLQTQFDHVTLARLAFEGGAGAVQLREKRPRSTRALIEIAVAARRDDRVVIIDDRTDVAAAAGVGVHVGAEDLPVSVARRLLGPDAIVGFSTRTVEGARAVTDVDYIGVGPVYGTRSKPGLTTPLGLEMLARIVRVSPVPVIAIGGITAEHVPEVLATGAYGVAAISAIVCAQDPAAATAKFVEAIEGAS